MRAASQIITLFFVLFAITTMLTLPYSAISEGNGFVNQIIVSEGESIQVAINNAKDGDVIFVKKGVYNEQILVNKSVSLVGESIEGVILDGKGEYPFLINIFVDEVRLENFTIMNVSSTYPYACIHVKDARSVEVRNCKIVMGFCGILFTNSSNCRLFSNKISNVTVGIKLHLNSNENILNGNLVSNNTWGIYIDSSSRNLIFHNSFVNNTHSYWRDDSYNYWDNGYPSGGNYWGDYPLTDQYSGIDQNIEGSDGIGDYPYPNEENAMDNFPFVNPILTKSYTYDDYIHYFLISTNLTVLDFYFYPDKDASFNFTVKGVNMSLYCCRIIIPSYLLWTNSSEEWIVKVNNATLTAMVEQDNNNSYIYFCFTLKKNIGTVEIAGTNAIPETYSILSIFIFLVVLLLIQISTKLVSKIFEAKLKIVRMGK